MQITLNENEYNKMDKNRRDLEKLQDQIKDAVQIHESGMSKEDYQNGKKPESAEVEINVNKLLKLLNANDDVFEDRIALINIPYIKMPSGDLNPIYIKTGILDASSIETMAKEVNKNIGEKMRVIGYGLGERR